MYFYRSDEKNAYAVKLGAIADTLAKALKRAGRICVKI